MKTLFRFIKNIKSFWKFYKDYEYNGEVCEFIIENYQEVLCSRTKTMSKPTYYAEDVIAEIDRWHSEMWWKTMYKFEPIENVKERGEKTDKVETCEFPERKHVHVNCR